MAKSRRIIVLILLAISMAMLLGSCSVFTAIFGPNKNAILDWLPNWKEGTKLVMKYSEYNADGSLYSTPTSYQDEITLIEKTDTTVTYTIRETWTGGSGTYYYIAQKTKGVLVQSGNNSFLDDADPIYLKTPVEDGTNWYVTPTSTTKFTISSAKTTKDVAAGTYKDAVYVKVFDGAGNSVGEYYYSPTGTLLYQKILFSDNSYAIYELQSVTQP